MASVLSDCSGSAETGSSHSSVKVMIRPTAGHLLWQPQKKGEPPATTPVEGLRKPTKEDSPADSQTGVRQRNRYLRMKIRSSLQARTLGQTKFKLFATNKILRQGRGGVNNIFPATAMPGDILMAAPGNANLPIGAETPPRAAQESGDPGLPTGARRLPLARRNRGYRPAWFCGDQAKAASAPPHSIGCRVLRRRAKLENTSAAACPLECGGADAALACTGYPASPLRAEANRPRQAAAYLSHGV